MPDLVESLRVQAERFSRPTRCWVTSPTSSITRVLGRLPVASDVGYWSVVVSCSAGSLGEEFNDLVLEPCVHGVQAREARLRSGGCCERVFEDRAHLSRCFEAEAHEPLPTSGVDAIREASFSGGSDALDETDADECGGGGADRGGRQAERVAQLFGGLLWGFADDEP